MPDFEDPDSHDASSIDDLTNKREKKWNRENAVETQLSMEVRPRPELRGENPYIVGALKLSGDLHVRKDFHAGERLTVQVADADGNIVTTGIFELGLPGFKDVKMGGHAGIIGVERVHTAKVVHDE